MQLTFLSAVFTILISATQSHDLDLDVMDHVTNRFAICHFLMVAHWNRASISNRFRDIQPPKLVHTDRHTKVKTVHLL